MDELLKIFDKTLGYPVDVDFADWDSVENTDLIIAVEKHYGVRFLTTEHHANKSIESLWNAIQTKLKAKQRETGVVKVVILDCDNTLWGGVIGEDLLDGIDVTGKWVDFQKKIVDLESRGYLVCLCSKNNASDVLEVFERHQGMTLKLRHVCAYEISWGKKSEGIQRLADRLNIGLDTVVFIDDSPVERDEVRSALSEVIVPDFPFNDWELFSAKATQGSLTEKYKAAMQFREAEKGESFEASLQMKARLYTNRVIDFARAAELSQKTNQFNLTLARLTEDDIRNICKRGGMLFCGWLEDRYGDHGLTSMAIIRDSEKGWELVDFCVSCRVLGRGFEREFIRRIFEGFSFVNTTHRPGPKNQMCADFFKTLEKSPSVPIEWIP